MATFDALSLHYREESQRADDLAVYEIDMDLYNLTMSKDE